jgi:predicted phosphodiesterase
MRVGLLADVHANLPALRAALGQLAAEGVDTLLVAGDLVGYGASPNECIELLAESEAVCVAGNHDLFMIGRLPGTRFSGIALRAAEVTGPLLSSDTRDYLAGLPLARRIDGVVMAHGSLDDPEEYVEDRPRALQLLREMRLREPGSHTLVLGHTHHQRRVQALTVRAEGRRAQLVNPGSVGQSRARERRPRVRLAVLDTELGSLRFLRVHYDVAEAHRRLLALGLNDQCLHSAPELSYRIAHRLPPRTRSTLKQLRDRVIATTPGAAV